MTGQQSLDSHVWRGPPISNLPRCDIVSYTFQHYGQYDLDEPILIDATDSDKFISIRKARILVRQLVKGWKTHGLTTGDSVCLNSKNNVLWPILALGIVGAGGCVAGCNPAYTVPELIHHFKVTKSTFIIAEIEGIKSVLEAADHCSIHRSRILLLNPAEDCVPFGLWSWETLLQYGQSDWMSFNDEFQARNTIAFLASTSGTTGLPKAAALSHQYFVTQDEVRQQERVHRSGSKVTQLLCLPIFHAFACQLALITPLRHGIPTYLLPRFHLDTFVDSVSKYGVSDIAIVPPIASALMTPENNVTHRLESLRYIICAGAPLDAHIQSRLYRYLPEEVVVAQLWGSTETAWISMFGRTEKDDSGSVGRLLPGTELKIIDNDGCTITTESVRGEALIRSPAIFNGYISNTEANANAFDSEGYFRTGDLAYYEDGKVYLGGRTKDIMKVRGWQVSPTELEGILLHHPMVKDVAVVSSTGYDANGLEATLPCAFIVPRSFPSSPLKTILTAESIHEFLEGKVVSYKKLTGGVIFTEAIPRNPTGKILRRILQDRLRNGRLS